jgi:sugar/nucleoside kinase (ribokinase family)
MSIVVFGSINIDLVAHTPRLPEPGETLIGRSFTTVPGGKGANQALLLLQLEIPLEIVVAATRLAHERGVKVMLDPAPAQKLPAEIYHHADLLIPNETEAASLTGTAISSIEDAALAAGKLLSSGVRRVIVKMGSQGALAVTKSGA